MTLKGRYALYGSKDASIRAHHKNILSAAKCKPVTLVSKNIHSVSKNGPRRYITYRGINDSERFWWGTKPWKQHGLKLKYVYWINSRGVNESDKEFQIKEIFNDKNDVRKMMFAILCCAKRTFNRRWRTSFLFFIVLKSLLSKFFYHFH